MSTVVRRQAPSAFNASLLDMMTCGFGAVILLFVLKAAVELDRANDLASRANRSEVVLVTLQNEQKEVAKEIERTREETAEFGEPAVWGLPPIEGELLVVVDISASMRNGVIQPAVAKILRDFVANNPGISQLSIWRFADKAEKSPWMDWGRADRLRDAPLETKLFDETGDIGRGTNLLQGLGANMRTAAARGAPANVLLISDGMHNVPEDEQGITTEEGIKRIEAQLEVVDGRPRAPHALYAIGLFRVAVDPTTHYAAGESTFTDALSCQGGLVPPGDTLRLARLLRAAAHRWHGSLLGVTLPCD